MSKVCFVSHRGLRSAKEIGNTLKSFAKARDAGFKHLETDLRVSKDGKIFLFHDEKLGDIALEDLRAESLRKLKLPSGEKILFFKEFIEQFSNMSWTLDIKKEQAERTLEILRKNYNEVLQLKGSELFFLTWTKKSEASVKRAYKKAQLYARPFQIYKALIFAKVIKNYIYAIPPKYCGISLFKSSVLRRIQNRGGKCVAYLPHNKSQVDLARKLKFNQILLDEKLF